MVCLLETRVKENNMMSIISRHFQGWQFLHNYSNDAQNGRIWVIWNNTLQVEFIDSMEQCITCSVSYGIQKFFLVQCMDVMRGLIEDGCGLI